MGTYLQGIEKYVKTEDNFTQYQPGEKEIPEPSYTYDIYGLEIADLRKRIERLEKEVKRQIIPINFLGSEKLNLRKSFNAVLEYHPRDNLYIVDCPELDIYGEGQDEISAIEDFKIALEETYFDLKGDRDKLNPSLGKEWKALRDILEEK